MLWLLLLMAAAFITAVVLLGRGFGALGRHGIRRSGPGVLLRGLACVAGGAALVLYVWGMLHVALAILDAEDGGTDSAPIRPCRTAGWVERERSDGGIVDYTVDYIPLRFVCETQGGGSYAPDRVPGYLNPAVLGIGLTAVGLAVAAALESEYRARAEHKKGSGRL
jgi:hypothetical protein